MVVIVEFVKAIILTNFLARFHIKQGWFGTQSAVVAGGHFFLPPNIISV
jgi:hypothetical protein